jgi:hypothetical protein
MLNNNISYLRKEISSTLLAFSAIQIILASSLLLSNPLLQPVQAQTTPMTFKTPIPASSGDSLTLTFDAQGSYSSSSNQGTVTNGTFVFTITGKTRNGEIHSGIFNHQSFGPYLDMVGQVKGIDLFYNIVTSCSSSNSNHITVTIHGPRGERNSFDAYGPVECPPSQ